jgi:hypothetical protein
VVAKLSLLDSTYDDGVSEASEALDESDEVEPAMSVMLYAIESVRTNVNFQISWRPT